METRSTAHVEIAYDGPPGVMDAEELAPALLGVSALCKRANELFNGSASSIKVNVRSDFKTGSFGIDLDVVQIVAGVSPLLTPDNLKTARDIAALLGLVVVGDDKAFTSLLGLVKWLRGSRVTKVEPKDTNVFTVSNEHGDNITINGDVHTLIMNASIREAAHQALKPLERPEITGFQVKNEGRILEQVPEEAVAFFHQDEPVPTLPLPAEEVLSDSTNRHAFEVVRPSFDPTLMWKMSDGERHFDMHIDDENFRERVAGGEFEFRAGTAVVGLYRIRSTRGPGAKIRTEYRLISMIEVRRPPAASETASLFS